MGRIKALLGEALYLRDLLYALQAQKNLRREDFDVDLLCESQTVVGSVNLLDHADAIKQRAEAGACGISAAQDPVQSKEET